MVYASSTIAQVSVRTHVICSKGIPTALDSEYNNRSKYARPTHPHNSTVFAR